jgi:chromosome segregation ATPase
MPTATTDLDNLISTYALNKQELDSYKKICDVENAQIKDLMYQFGETEHSNGEYVAKRTEVEKESLNEEKLLAVIKAHNIKDVIRTKEYVDMDALESYLYNNEATNELAADLAKCKETKTEVRLTVHRVKKKKEED